MAYKLVQTRTDTLSPKRAQEILTKYNTFPGQRNLDMRWAQSIASLIESGKFAKAHVVLASNGTLDSTVLMNGQHQCQGIVLADTSVRTTFDEYHCDEADDFWKLFSAQDANRPRSERHCMNAARGLFSSEALRSVDSRTCTTCGTALSFLDAGTVPNFQAKPISKDVKPGLVQKYEADVLFYKSVLDAAQARHAVVCVCCAVIATGRISKAKAFDFWSRVLGGYDLQRGTPEYHLHKDISSGMTPGAAGASRLVRQWNLCAAWWNSFIKKDGRKSVKLESIKGILELEKPR